MKIYQTPEDEKIIFLWIDKIVEFLPAFESDSFLSLMAKMQCNEDEILIKNIGYTMLKLQILETKIQGVIQFSDFGRIIKEHGNYSKYLNVLNEQKQKQIIKEQKEIENLNFSITLNKWLIRTKWLPHLLSILALIISLISIFT